ncbi:MAG: hypothetical protein COC01_02700 [Bacteroidetes bacterium]|nr:MAG: hypothetical protein COC01_02700 [Bacteroidota bacterium]
MKRKEIQITVLTILLCTLLYSVAFAQNPGKNPNTPIPSKVEKTKEIFEFELIYVAGESIRNTFKDEWNIEHKIYNNLEDVITNIDAIHKFYIDYVDDISQSSKKTIYIWRGAANQNNSLNNNREIIRYNPESKKIVE